MKAKREHRVPLSPRALAILNELPRLDGGEFVFPGMRAGRPLSDMSLTAVLKRMGYSSLTVHGLPTLPARWSRKRWRTPSQIRWRRPIGAAICSRSDDG